MKFGCCGNVYLYLYFIKVKAIIYKKEIVIAAINSYCWNIPGANKESCG